MAAANFVPGQRWISSTEADLGLGVVVGFANRRVEIAFPASEEHRTYAADNAPLSRVVYEAGEWVEDQDENSLKIVERLENNGCYIYRCVDEEGNEVILPEMQLNSAVHFSRPEQRLLAGQVDRHSLYKLRIRALEHQYRVQASPAYGLLGARVQLLPHQLHIASELSNRAHPRALLADEVGLGKTIEAGLVMHKRLLTGRVSRVMVVVPDNLLHQWLVELLRRFNLKFSVFDATRYELLEISGEENPFESAQLVLCPLSLVTQSDERLNKAVEAGWDMMVVDEAHHLGWSVDAPSHGYNCIEALTQVVPDVLLLTATPEQLGPEGHFARLRLLDPERYHDLESFIAESARYHELSALVAPLVDEGAERLRNDPELQKQLEAWLGLDELNQWLALSAEEQPQALNRIVRDLIDRQGTGRVLFRNTRAAVQGFPQRQLVAEPMDAPADYLAAEEATLEQRLHPEELMGDDWIENDPRVQWLVDWLAQHRKEKVLLICASAQTAMALENHLNLRVGVRTAAFHERMSLLNRDRAAAYFADQELGAQILLCSEIGSEGRNFQFASHLVLFDLPMSPDLLEQRIGRLDRIGQQNDISIHVPFYEHSATSVLLRWYDEALNMFDHVCAVGEALYREFAAPLAACLEQPDDTAALDDLVKQAALRREELEAQLSEGRDRLLELSSCDREHADQVVQEVAEQEQSAELQAFAEKLFDRFGIDTQPHGENGLVIKPGEHMLCQVPGLSEEGMTLTFSRERALIREDLEFMSWEHPLLVTLLDLLLNGEFGNNSVVTLKLPPLPAGTLLLETVYVPQATAPRGLQLSRFLPQSQVRVLVTADGKNLASALGFEPLNKLANTVSRNAAQNMVRLAREQLVAQLKQAEKHAQGQLPALVESALESMNTEQGAERDRLEALAKVNPAIHPQELELLDKQHAALQHALEKTELVLSALRVIVVAD